MKRLELIMSNDMQNDDTLTRDEVLALLSESLDRTLTVDEDARLARAIAADPSLAALREGFVRGRTLLQEAPRPTAPDDLLPRVHRALADERRGGAPDVAPVVELPRPAWRAPAFALLSAAAVVALVVVVAPDLGGAPDVGAAGIGAEGAREATVQVSEVSVELVVERARAEGLEPVVEGSVVRFTGPASTVHRLVRAVRVRALDNGGRVTGAVPEEGEVALSIVVE